MSTTRFASRCIEEDRLEEKLQAQGLPHKVRLMRTGKLTGKLGLSKMLIADESGGGTCGVKGASVLVAESFQQLTLQMQNTHAGQGAVTAPKDKNSFTDRTSAPTKKLITHSL